MRKVPPEIVRDKVRTDRAVNTLLDRLVTRGVVTERGAARVLAVAWSLCDLRDDPAPTLADIDLAVHLRRNSM
ncbi:hypothetical protein [Nocardia transvalensis]|uniref:magnesium chelatase subunit ChlI family protein n=1 Tax=Nocardia transvalensis TaxID=37333 RepID=UPI003A5D038D